MLERKVDTSNKTLLVSVIVPAYKVENYLNDCVDSIINQTYDNIEIILVDDGSPDRCPAICDEYAAKDERVIVIHKTNGGLSDARNAGIKKATGDYILFVDSDDKLAQSDVIENLVEFLIKTNSKVTYCPHIVRTLENGGLLKPKGIENEFYPVTSIELLELVLKNHLIIAAWSFVVQRSYILEHSLFFVERLIFEDMDYLPRLLNVEDNLKIDIFIKPFYLYRYNPDSITNTFSVNHFNSMNKIIAGLVEKLKADPKDRFSIIWLNNNIYCMLSFFEKDCLANSDFFKSNIGTVKQLFKANYKVLNFRNKILYIIILFNPKLFFIVRQWIKNILWR